MKLVLQGERQMASGPEVVWEVLTDPAALARITPGCKELKPLGPDRYEASLEMGVAAIRGRYKGTLAIADQRPGEGYTLHIKGTGTPGHVTARLRLDLVGGDEGTLFRYDGEAEVGGLVAGVGSRLLGGVSRMLMDQFCDAIEREVKSRQASPVAASQ